MKTLQEIQQIREEKRKELDLRVNLNAITKEKHILVCRGTGCTSSKSPKIIEKFRDSEGNLSAYQISLFVLQESLEYTNKMIYTLFSAILEDNAHS